MAYEYAKEKYVFDWVCFVEDDVIYSDTWYDTLITMASKLYGKKSPLGLYYGAFSASGGVIKTDDSVAYDKENDVYAEMFGPRADQRLYKVSHYESVSRVWDSDILGISSCQTGTVNHRGTMRGFCAANIGHRSLCKFADEEESTWVDERDIGPAAFDKRIAGYQSVIKRAEQVSTADSEILAVTGGEGVAIESSTGFSSGVASIAPQTDKPMTSISLEKVSFTKKVQRKVRSGLRRFGVNS